MAITTTALGPNSASIVYDAGTALADLITAVDAYVVAHGWSLFDASAGTNARAYRAINKDGSTYKYVVLDFNTAGYLLCKVYESWNEVAHTGTNICFGSNSTSLSPQINLATGATLYFFVCVRWLLILSKVAITYGSSTNNGTAGCMETAREAEGDTVAFGLPCWGFINTGYWGVATSVDSGKFTYPRLAGGEIGTQMSSMIATAFAGTGASSANSAFVANPQSLTTCVPGTLDRITGKYWVSSLRVYTLYSALLTAASAELKGKMFGLKVYSASQGAMLDDISVKVDADFNLDSTGAATLHHVIVGSSSDSSKLRLLIPK